MRIFMQHKALVEKCGMEKADEGQSIEMRPYDSSPFFHVSKRNSQHGNDDDEECEELLLHGYGSSDSQVTVHDRQSPDSSSGAERSSTPVNTSSNSSTPVNSSSSTSSEGDTGSVKEYTFPHNSSDGENSAVREYTFPEYSYSPDNAYAFSDVDNNSQQSIVANDSLSNSSCTTVKTRNSESSELFNSTGDERRSSDELQSSPALQESGGGTLYKRNKRTKCEEVEQSSLTSVDSSDQVSYEEDYLASRESSSSVESIMNTIKRRPQPNKTIRDENNNTCNDIDEKAVLRLLTGISKARSLSRYISKKIQDEIGEEAEGNVQRQSPHLQADDDGGRKSGISERSQSTISSSPDPVLVRNLVRNLIRGSSEDVVEKLPQEQKELFNRFSKGSVAHGLASLFKCDSDGLCDVIDKRDHIYNTIPEIAIENCNGKRISPVQQEAGDFDADGTIRPKSKVRRKTSLQYACNDDTSFFIDLIRTRMDTPSGNFNKAALLKSGEHRSGGDTSSDGLQWDSFLSHLTSREQSSEKSNEKGGTSRDKNDKPYSRTLLSSLLKTCAKNGFIKQDVVGEEEGSPSKGSNKKSQIGANLIRFISGDGATDEILVDRRRSGSGQFQGIEHTINLLRKYSSKRNHKKEEHNNKESNTKDDKEREEQPKGCCKRSKGSKCLAIGTLIIQVFTVLGIMLTMMRNWSVIEAFFVKGKAKNPLQSIISKLFHSDDISMLANEEHAMIYLCRTYEKRDLTDERRKFNSLSVIKQALILSCKNVDVEYGQYLMSGERFSGYLGEQRRADIFLHRRSLIDKYIGFSHYKIDSQNKFSYARQDNSALVREMVGTLKSINSTASPPMIIPLKSIKVKMPDSYISVVAGLKVLRKLELKIDNVLKRLSNRSHLGMDEGEWLSRYTQTSRDVEIASWIFNKWIALEDKDVKNNTERPKARFEKYEEALFVDMKSIAEKMKISNLSMEYKQMEYRIGEFKNEQLNILAHKERAIKSKILRKLRRFGIKCDNKCIELPFINQAKLTVSRNDPDPMGFAKAIKEMIILERKQLIDNNEVFKKGELLRRKLRLGIQNAVKYLPIEFGSLTVYDTALKSLYNSILTFEDRKDPNYIDSIFSVMRDSVPLFHLHGATAGSLAYVTNCIISIYHNQPIISKLMRHMINKQKEFIEECTKDNCLSDLIRSKFTQKSSSRKLKDVELNSLHEALNEQNQLASGYEEAKDTTNHMQSIIYLLCAHEVLLAPIVNDNLHLDNLNILLNSLRMLETEITFQKGETFLRRYCYDKNNRIAQNQVCKSVFNFHLVTSSLVDVMMWNLKLAIRTSSFELIVAMTKSQVLKQRQMHLSDFLAAISLSGRTDLDYMFQYCAYSCQKKRSGDEEMINLGEKWIFEYLRFILKIKFDDSSCRHHCDWVTIQRRSDGSTDFNRHFKDYEEGFGHERKEYWAGLTQISQMCSQQSKCQLRMVSEDIANKTEVSEYKSFWLEDGRWEYKLHVAEPAGNDTSLLEHDGMSFSVLINQTLKNSTNCEPDFRSGFWWNIGTNETTPCTDIDPVNNINGVYYRGDTSDVTSMKTRPAYFMQWKSRLLKSVELQVRINR